MELSVAQSHFRDAVHGGSRELPSNLAAWLAAAL